MEKKGKQITIKGILYEDNSIKVKDDIYSSKKDIPKFDAKGAEAVGAEVTSQATQSTVQAVVAQVQAQAQALGASGMIAVGSAGAFQVNHINDNYVEAFEKAEPVVAELVDTGTVSQETIATVLPADSKFQGKEMPVVQTVLGKPVGEYKKQVEAEKNMTDEEKEIQKQFQKSVSPPSPSDSEKDGSMTSVKERNRSMT
jgi:hypothetical protein